jgi:hypothetical protein
MPKHTPLQEVRQRFGSKEELVKQLLSKLEQDEDADAEEWTRRVSTMSNKKLLRLLAVSELLAQQFGSKEKLVEALVQRKFPKGNAPYAEKLGRTSTTRLLDLYGVRL